MATSYVHATFREQRAAVQAAETLLASEFPARDITAIVCDASQQSGAELKIRHKTMVPMGAMVGAVAGCILGALVAAFWGVPSDQGVFTIRGAVIGTAIGTLAGALFGLGRWRDTILFPKEVFANGCVIVGVTTHEGRIGEAQRALSEAGAADVQVSSKREALADVRARATATEAL